MPTGYTAEVGNGKVTEFSDFAMECARAFGALVTLRDSPHATIPDEFEPNTYNAEAIKEAEIRIAALDAMDADEIRRQATAAYDARLAAYRKAERERATTRARYEAMLDHVLAWEPPTTDHVEMKSFMVKQLEESIRFDCGYDYPIPARETPDEWFAEERRRAIRDLEYHVKADREERERTEQRTAWVRALRESLR